ncbi:MAG: PHP-associated domain-containing protein [Promethearchaeota archaeon]
MTIIDMHIHLKNRSPCSIMSEHELFDKISPRLNGLCITDHWILKPFNLSYFSDIKVFFGAEITCDMGDLLAYGIKLLPSKNLTAKEMIDFIHKQGGIAVCAHPFSNRHYAFGENVYDFDFDAIEINGAIGKKYNKMAESAAIIMDLPTIGGSDAHSPTQLNTFGTKFESAIHSMLDIISSIKANKCKVVRV